MRLDDAAMDQSLVHCSDHVRHMQEHRDGSARLATLELGTGWYAVVPIGMFLCGAERVITVDLTPLLRPDNLCLAIRKFREYHERGRLTERLPAIDAERLRAVLSLADAAESMTIDEIWEP